VGAPCCCCCCCALSLSLDAGRFRSEKEARGGRCVFVVRACSRGREGEKEEAGIETESDTGWVRRLMMFVCLRTALALDRGRVGLSCSPRRRRRRRRRAHRSNPPPTPLRPCWMRGPQARPLRLHHRRRRTPTPTTSSSQPQSRFSPAERVSLAHNKPKRGQEHPSSLNLLSLHAKATSQIPAQHLPTRSSPTPTPSPPPPCLAPSTSRKRRNAVQHQDCCGHGCVILSKEEVFEEEQSRERKTRARV